MNQYLMRSIRVFGRKYLSKNRNTSKVECLYKDLKELIKMWRRQGNPDIRIIGKFFATEFFCDTNNHCWYVKIHHIRDDEWFQMWIRYNDDLSTIYNNVGWLIRSTYDKTYIM